MKPVSSSAGLQEGFKLFDSNGRGKLECRPTIKRADAQRAAEVVAERLLEPASSEFDGLRPIDAGPEISPLPDPLPDPACGVGPGF